MRFRSREALIQAAVAKAQEAGVQILIQGERYICEPQEVLIGPEPFKTEMNKLYEECEANNGWEGDKATMERIDKDYQALMKRFA